MNLADLDAIRRAIPHQTPASHMLVDAIAGLPPSARVQIILATIEATLTAKECHALGAAMEQTAYMAIRQREYEESRS